MTTTFERTQSAFTDKRLIGLTGNIATGKSAVRSMLVRLGAAAVDADEVAREVVQPGRPALAAIAHAFGPAVIQPDGALDRRALAAIVFQSPEKLRMLEGITHPAVRTEIVRRLEQLPAGSVVVIEAIKLLESGWRAHCEEIWVTTCAPAVQLRRLIEARGMSESEARMRIDAQPPQAEKVAAADVVIDSNHPLAEMQAQVEREWRRFLRSL